MRKPDETIIEYVRRAVSWLDQNSETMLDALPTVESAFELFDLISDTYDTSTINEMYELIADEGDDPTPLIAFINKYPAVKAVWAMPAKANTGKDGGAKFTPGPYRRSTGNFGNMIEADSGKRDYDLDTGWRPIATFQACTNKRLAAEEDENQEANGALFIAAPDGFAVAVAAYRSFLALPLGNVVRAINQPLMAALRDYIAKATGATAEEVQTLYENEPSALLAQAERSKP